MMSGTKREPILLMFAWRGFHYVFSHQSLPDGFGVRAEVKLHSERAVFLLAHYADIAAPQVLTLASSAGDLFDLVVETTGSPSTFPQVLHFINTGGGVALLDFTGAAAMAPKDRGIKAARLCGVIGGRGASR